MVFECVDFVGFEVLEILDINCFVSWGGGNEVVDFGVLGDGIDGIVVVIVGNGSCFGVVSGVDVNDLYCYIVWYGVDLGWGDWVVLDIVDDMVVVGVFVLRFYFFVSVVVWV